MSDAPTASASHLELFGAVQQSLPVDIPEHGISTGVDGAVASDSGRFSPRSDSSDIGPIGESDSSEDDISEGLDKDREVPAQPADSVVGDGAARVARGESPGGSGGEHDPSILALFPRVADRRPIGRIGERDGDESISSPIGPIGEHGSDDSLSSPIGPVGERDIFDSDETEPIGETPEGSDEEIPLPPAQSTAEYPPITHFPNMFTSPYGMVSPTVIRSRSPSPSASNTPAEVREEYTRRRLEWELERVRSRRTQFADELHSLRRADHLLGLEPESLVGSRSPFWDNYNAIIGARGELFQYVWHDHSEDIEYGDAS